MTDFIYSIHMKRLYLFLFALCSLFGYSQDYIRNENFKEANDIKFRVPFEPDWNRDFFIETNIKVVITKTPNKEQTQLLFGFDEDSDSYYGLSIQYSFSNLNMYADYYAISSSNNPTFIESNNEWQLTSIINHSAYNRLQIYKIDNELYFSINDQVVAYIPEIKAKGKQEVEQFLTQFKIFGSSYTLNYNNYDYVNIASDPLMVKSGIRGTTHAIGKFYTTNGGSILALGISNNQYTVESFTVTYSVFGVHVKREKLGFTQIKNGVATQIANVNVRRDSSGPTIYIRLL